MIKQEEEKPLKTFCVVLMDPIGQLFQHFPPQSSPTSLTVIPWSRGMGSCLAAEHLPASPGPLWVLLILPFSTGVSPVPPVTHPAGGHLATGDVMSISCSPSTPSFWEIFPTPNFREALPPLWHNIFLLPEIPTYSHPVLG